MSTSPGFIKFLTLWFKCSNIDILTVLFYLMYLEKITKSFL